MKRATQNPEAHRAAIAILHYLSDHPTAKDSAGGIAKWWVGEERDMVEKALAQLVAAGVIAKRRHIYQLARRVAKTEKRMNQNKIRHRRRKK